MYFYLLGLFVLFFVSSAQAAVIYIDSDLGVDCSGDYSILGRDCNGSDGNAYNDIQAALTASSINDTINVRYGTVVSNVSGSDGIKPKDGQTWQTYPGDMGTGRATIQAGSGYRGVFWMCCNIANVTIQNLIIEGANEWGVYAAQCDNLVLYNLDVSGWNMIDETFK